MEIGIHSFAAMLPDSGTGRVPSPAERLAALVDEIVLADRVGIGSFGVGEHHRPEYADASPAVILAAAAGRARTIRLTSAVSVLGTADPVRLFQDFATLDLISQGRAEIIVGRGSFAEAYPLFGFERADYDTLFAEKLDLLLALRAQTHVHWSGRFRPGVDRSGRLSAPATAGAADLAGRRRHAGVVRPRRHARPAADDRHHRRVLRAVRAVSSALPRGWPPRRSSTGAIAARSACHGLPGRHDGGRQSRHLPRLAICLHQTRARTRLADADAGAVSTPPAAPMARIWSATPIR